LEAAEAKDQTDLGALSGNRVGLQPEKITNTPGSILACKFSKDFNSISPACGR